MNFSIKYLIFYVISGGVTGYIAKGDKKIALIGLALSAVMGYSFGINYAIISLLEFCFGFAIGSIVNKNN